MVPNPTEARHQLQRAEFDLASAERALARAVRALPSPLRESTQDLQLDVQHSIRRVGRFLEHARTHAGDETEPAA